MDILLRQLDIWYRNGLGAELLKAERAHLANLLPSCHGQLILQIGGPSEQFLLQDALITNCVRISPEFKSVFRGISLQAYLHELPLQAGSMEIILLPHALEFTRKADEMLQEIYHILAPGGQLIILGFNALSLWNFARLTKTQAVPWRGHFFSVFTVSQRLKKLGFVIKDSGSFFFRPPVDDMKLLKKTLFMEALGSYLWADCGGVYWIAAEKPGIPLNLVGSYDYSHASAH